MAPRKRPPLPPPAQVMCDNHPAVPAAHTTSSTLHQPISMCATCLGRVGPHLKDR